MTSNAERAAILTRALRARFEGDRDALGALYTDDVRVWTPALSAASMDELLVEFDRQDDAFSDIAIEVSPLDVGGEYACAEWIVSMTHSGPLEVAEGRVVDATGTRVVLNGVTVAEFSGDRICSLRQYWDEFAIFDQLGFVQAAPRGMTMTEAFASVEDRIARGRSARSGVPRSSHGEWKAPDERTDPVEVLHMQAETRVPELIPLRHERMLVSPFTFYRGAAAIMAADLAGTPNSGIRVQCCGDAHLSNFGGFQAPDRQMVFDINDFDETTPGPWEWDLKRLAVSFVIAAQDREWDANVGRETVLSTVASYREAMRGFASMRNLDVWYSRLDVAAVMARWGDEMKKQDAKRFERGAAKATAKDSLRVFAKLTERAGDTVRIISDPPLVTRVEDVYGLNSVDDIMGELNGLYQTYKRTLQRDRHHLIDSYRLVDLARKVVGVGSVGTRCWIALLLGRDDDDPLFMQIKEAETSVLEPYVGKSRYASHGRRVVEGQKLMQAASDIFLGWDHVHGIDGVERDYYLRQLWDGKVSADLTRLSPSQLTTYGRMCGWTLARAHARSGDRVAIGAYLGSGDVFGRAIVDFAETYADRNASDYAAVLEASKSGRL